jgi:hypothetical protein
MSTTADLVSLTAQLQAIADRQEIADLILRLGLMLDEKGYDDAPTIFADDVTVQTAGGSAHGRAAVVEQARRNHTVRTQHAITGVLITLAGDRAEARANLIVTFVPDSEQPEARLVIGTAAPPEGRLMLGERYRFAAVRGESGWRLTRIEVARLWSTQPVPAGALVTQSNRGAGTGAS